MRRLKLHNLVVAIGLGVTFLGLANAASVVSAISSPATTVDSMTAEVGTASWPADPAGDQLSGQLETASAQTGTGWVGEALPAPSASFLAQVGSEEHADFISANNQLLSDSHEAEMLYPQEMAEQIRALPTPVAPEIPLRLVIPAIELDAPILPAEAEVVAITGKTFQVWRAPDQFGAGWHVTSATLGVIGNTVLNGHHNVHGEVFKRLADLNPGDQVIVESEFASYTYIIVNRMILPEKYAPLEDRIKNAQWILPSEDERLTLITCWPYESNTHRLILVARPEK